MPSLVAQSFCQKCQEQCLMKPKNVPTSFSTAWKKMNMKKEVVCSVKMHHILDELCILMNNDHLHRLTITIRIPLSIRTTIVLSVKFYI